MLEVKVGICITVGIKKFLDLKENIPRVRLFCL